MPSFGCKRLGLASTARQAGEGHTSIDSTVSVRALPGGIFFESFTEMSPTGAFFFWGWDGMKILYICDRARCMVCNPDCRHTSELAHAAHFDAQPYADTLAELFCYWEGALWERDGTELCI